MLSLCWRFSHICYRSKHIHIIEMHLQTCLNKLQNWADTNGFKFSTSKTVCMHFCRLRKLNPEPELLLNDTPIPVVEEVTFLSLIFDRKLSFLPHLTYINNKCMKADRKLERPVWAKTGVQYDVRYGGAMPWRHLYTSTAVLNLILCRTGSQWRSRNTGVVCSNLLAPVMKRAAVFWITCILYL